MASSSSAPKEIGLSTMASSSSAPKEVNPSTMASSSATIPSTSASNGISQSEEKTKEIQTPVPPKAKNGGPKSLPHDPIKKKPLSLMNPVNWKLRKFKRKSPNPSKETKEPKEEDAQKIKIETEKEVKAILSLIEADFHSIDNAKGQIEKHKKNLELAWKKFEELKKDPHAKDLREFKKAVKKLKQEISSRDKKDDAKDVEELLKLIESFSMEYAKVDNALTQGMMPNLFDDPDFVRTQQFQEFKVRYNELPLELKLCLLCFSVFPDNVEIKRRVMVFWWIGEGFVPPRKHRPEESTDPQRWDKFYLKKSKPEDEDFTPERWGSHFFKILLDMGFVEEAQKKPNPKVDVCKMHPFVRSMLNRIAKEAKFFEFDDDGSVNEKFDESLRACLFNGKDLTEDDKLLKSLHAIMNVNESILDIKQDSLSKMKNANVLYLGRWQNLGTHHIEVDDSRILNAKKGSKLLDGLQNIKNLKFLSLQGISRITELPKSILKLQNLTILDIRACHNLEKIPDDIGRLENLTHLDMSECFLLDDMPKGISKLTKLQVLSGFVILEKANKDTCSLDDLKGFPSLRKLSIHSGSDNFPLKEDLEALNQFKSLSKLTIAWGRGSASKQRELTKATTMKMENSEDSKKGGSDESKIARKGDDEDRSKKDNIQGKKEPGKGKAILEEGTKETVAEGRKKGNALQIKEINENSRQAKPLFDASSSSAIPEGKSLEGNKGSSLEGNQGTGLEGNKGTGLEGNQGKGILKEGTKETVKTRDLNTQVTDNTEQNRDSKSTNNAQGSQKKRIIFPNFGKSKQPDQPPNTIPAELPSQLTKLDLQCFPGTTNDWLRPEKLKNLEKLYIRGGKLFDLGHIEDVEDWDAPSEKKKWEKVTELRLKFLGDLDIEWRELLEMFPELHYLEKVDCPKLSFFPCDETGVWTKNITIS